MLITLSCILGGLLILVYGADRFLDGAMGTAAYFGLSPMLCGILIVGLATSMPEAFISASAAIAGKPILGVANALGSNIANIGLVLGLTMLIPVTRLRVPPLGRYLFLMLGSLLATLLVLRDLRLSLMDGIFLLCLLVVVLLFMISWRSANPNSKFDALNNKYHHQPKYRKLRVLFIGLILLVVGSKLLVFGAVELATRLGISEAVIGLTIVAVGTSLPELATSLISVMKGESEIAVGNIIGSNIFNSLGVLAIPALLSPAFLMPPEILYRDVFCMLLISTLLIIILLARKAKEFLTRANGFLLVLTFVTYQFLLFKGNL